MSQRALHYYVNEQGGALLSTQLNERERALVKRMPRDVNVFVDGAHVRVIDGTIHVDAPPSRPPTLLAVLEAVAVPIVPTVQVAYGIRIIDVGD